MTVSYKLALTMIDGKVCTSSSQRCSLCLCTSKQVNNIDEMLKKQISSDNLQFGISSLHASIRYSECLLHISYKLEVQKWQRHSEDRASVQSRTTKILLVHIPKPYGSTNDGNTVRRFFENPATSATITGIDEKLIKRFHVILQVISSGFAIDIPKYEQYCLETARFYVKLYPYAYYGS